MLCFPACWYHPQPPPAPAPPWDPFFLIYVSQDTAVGPRWLYLLYLVRSWTEPGQILWFSPSSKPWCSFLDNDFQADPLARTELPGRVLKLLSLLTHSLLSSWAGETQRSLVFPHIPDWAPFLSKDCFSSIILGCLQKTQIHLFIIWTPSCPTAFIFSMINCWYCGSGSCKTQTRKVQIWSCFIQIGLLKGSSSTPLKLDWYFPRSQISQAWNSAMNVSYLVDSIHYSTKPRARKKRKWQPTPVFLPRESPWTEKPGRLQSMGSQRVLDMTEVI